MKAILMDLTMDLTMGTRMGLMMDLSSLMGLTREKLRGT